jgi:hypothetical protein
MPVPRALDPELPRRQAFEALAAWLDEPEVGGLDGVLCNGKRQVVKRVGELAF